MAQSLQRIEPGTGGITRRAAGRGFSYVSANGKHIRSEKILARIAGLAIPPAWTQVWIVSQPNAHIQATGVDAAGRTQYIYHPKWREIQDSEKFIRSLAFAQRLPTIRRGVARDLRQEFNGQRRALAAGVRLIDRTGLRVGGAAYAKENGSFGATTLQRRHTDIEGTLLHLKFRGKSAGEWDLLVKDELLTNYLGSMPHTPRSAPALSYAVTSGRRKQWKPISDTALNSYLEELAGHGFTAKDFRTWQGTVVAACSLSRSLHSGTTSPDAVTAAIADAAAWLHNTPSVAREAYINPRVIALYEQGIVADLRKGRDRAVYELLAGSPRRR
ncbi:DNA topoisomerase IB [Arthrobacter sp. LAPM80]|uniref:DNA topoisomerase IB n=1 Tax=Arthrobacter sp. LAPM80 TaxID=3141788 RepID=UPI00398ACAB9